MTIIEAPTVKIYDFENRNGETKFGFVIRFDQQDEHYTPYLTNSREAIGLFIDPIDFAEKIQDMGSKYMVTPNAIVFEDKLSADIAIEVLLSELRGFAINTVERHLYDFGKANYFGKKPYYIEQIAKRVGIEPGHVSDEELNNEFETILVMRRGGLSIYGDNDVKHVIEFYDIETGTLTAEDGTEFDVGEVDLSYQ